MNTSIIVNLHANGLQLLDYPTNKVSVHGVLYKDTLQCKQNTSYPHNIKTGKQHFQLKLRGGGSLRSTLTPQLPQKLQINEQ